MEKKEINTGALDKYLDEESESFNIYDQDDAFLFTSDYDAFCLKQTDEEFLDLIEEEKKKQKINEQINKILGRKKHGK